MMARLSLFLDACTLAPFLGWGLMSLFAIPSYARSGWMAPVVIAIGSTIVCGVATRELWFRSHKMRRALIYAIFDDSKAAARTAKVNLQNRVKGWVALFCTVLCVLFTVLFLVAEYTIVAPAVPVALYASGSTTTLLPLTPRMISKLVALAG